MEAIKLSSYNRPLTNGYRKALKSIQKNFIMVYKVN